MCLSLMKASNPHTEIKIGVQLKQSCQNIHVASRVNCTTLDPGLSPILSHGNQRKTLTDALQKLCVSSSSVFYDRQYWSNILEEKEGEEKKPGFVIAEKSVEARKTEANEKKINLKYLFRCLTTFVIPSRSNDGEVKPYFLLKEFHVCRHTNLPPRHPAEKRIWLQSVLSCYSCKLGKPPPLGTIHNNRLVCTYFKCCGFFPFSVALFRELGKDGWLWNYHKPGNFISASQFSPGSSTHFARLL